MLNETERRDSAALLPFLADAATPVTRAFVGQATLMRFPAAVTVFEVVQGGLAIILGVLAAVFVLTSLVSFCPLYAPFGISTCGAPKGR